MPTRSWPMRSSRRCEGPSRPSISCPSPGKRRRSTTSGTVNSRLWTTKFFFAGVLEALPASKLCPLQDFTERCREAAMESGDGDCDESRTDTVLSYTFLVNGVLTTNVAGDPDNPVYVYQPITSAVFVEVEISSPSAHSHGHEQTFHVRASSWVAKAELNYDFYEKQGAQLSKLKENGEAMLSKEDQTILPEIQTHLSGVIMRHDGLAV